MICMKNLRFSCHPREKVGRQGPPGSARAQPWRSSLIIYFDISRIKNKKINKAPVGNNWFVYGSCCVSLTVPLCNYTVPTPPPSDNCTTNTTTTCTPPHTTRVSISFVYWTVLKEQYCKGFKPRSHVISEIWVSWWVNFWSCCRQYLTFRQLDSEVIIWVNNVLCNHNHLPHPLLRLSKPHALSWTTLTQAIIFTFL